MTAAREKIIEAMARALSVDHGDPDEIEKVTTYSEKDGFGTFERPFWQGFVEFASNSLAAIAEQGYAVVPRDGPDNSASDGCGFEQARIASEKGYWDDWKRAFYREMTAASDIARPDPAGEAKP